MHRMQWRSRLTHYDVRPFRKVSYSRRGRVDYVGQSEDGWSEGVQIAPGGATEQPRIEERSEWSAKCKIRRVDTFADHL